jgi:WD40 repeat protein
MRPAIQGRPAHALHAAVHAGTRLLVSCSSSSHHLFDAVRPEAAPLASYSGHVNGSFYIKACFSGDGRNILSGSSDHRAYIWEVSVNEAQDTAGLRSQCAPLDQRTSDLLAA